jgi:stage V sporulation protein R
MAGNGDPMGTLKDAWANYRDESFVLQYLSPRLIRKFRLFHLHDDAAEPTLKIDAIHDELGYRKVRSALSRQYDLARREPDIQVSDVDLAGDRRLILTHAVFDGVLLQEESCHDVLCHTAQLWGYPVRLLERDAATDQVLRTHDVDAP